ncbi:hypothetical protein GETHLI_03650 [Geothrix limicola]|uniref:DUF1570 domain-containing protein n=1 Tax=Geothrix limicola TaxID=2927978 RepID=A0ABQ5QBU3_9BACT|nr:DUF1570 domain-containing protein [Geothrix limicola]GLH71863.1 hypothetical protein GETHLI_03650 [Geothrix limicola]
MHAARWFRLLMLLSVLAYGPVLFAGRKEAWVEVKSPHFIAYSDAGEGEARDAVKGFEGIRSVFDTLFPGLRVDPPKPMILLVTEDEASMKRFMPEGWEGKDPTRPAGVFVQGQDRHYAILRLDVNQQVDQPYYVLFHEYTHSIVHQNFPRLPVWLDEGLADFYGATEIRSERVYLGRVPEGRLLKLRHSVRLPLETLLTVTHDSPHYREGEKTGIFYAQSWAFVHYLFMDDQARKAGLFQTYLKALSQNSDPLAAAQAGFGDLARLQETLTSYSNHSAFHFWNLPLALKLTDKDFQVRKIGEAEALVVRAEFLQHHHQEPQGRPLLDRALALAPELPEVQAALGHGFLLQGEDEKARQAFESALRLGSRDFRVPFQLALLAQNRRGGAAAEATQILAWLEAAIRLRPDVPPVHMALCRQYTLEPRDPAKALQAGRTALELEPQNLVNRVNFGYACISLDLEREAKAVGDQLNQLAATQSEKEMAGSYAASLARLLERKKALALAAVSPTGPGGVPSRSSNVAKPLKFSLSSHLAPLGQEVMRLSGEGRTEEAIRLVEKALAKANNAYDRKTLQSLLDTLKARIGQTGG